MMILTSTSMMTVINMKTLCDSKNNVTFSKKYNDIVLSSMTLSRKGMMTVSQTTSIMILSHKSVPDKEYDDTVPRKCLRQKVWWYCPTKVWWHWDKKYEDTCNKFDNTHSKLIWWRGFIQVWWLSHTGIMITPSHIRMMNVSHTYTMTVPSN